MKGKKTLCLIGMMVIISLMVFSGCAKKSETPNTQQPAATSTSSIILATTTSTQDSGLLDYLLPQFTSDTGIAVKVVAVGSGKAIQMGVDGEADVLLVHSKKAEEEFVKNGDGLKRFNVMYNDFLLIGPKNDPAGIAKKAGGNAVEAFKIIADKKAPFISRGDKSGTNTKELSIWKEANVSPAAIGGDWYISAGKGMGEVITMANEKLAYTLADRATFLKMEKNTTDLGIIVEKDKSLLNQYGVIAVNPAKNTKINAAGAQKFVDWILSDKTQKQIGEYGVKEYGQQLFVPNAKKGQ